MKKRVKNSKVRVSVIEYCMILEKGIGNLLTASLSLKKENSSSLQKMSFANKLEWLYDMKAVTSEDKKVLKFLGTIRNQFAHEIDAVDYSTCFNLIPSVKDQVLKHYGVVIDDEEMEEFYLEEAFTMIRSDSLEIITRLRNEIDDKRKKEKQVEDSLSFFGELLIFLDKSCESNKKFRDSFVTFLEEKHQMYPNIVANFDKNEIHKWQHLTEDTI